MAKQIPNQSTTAGLGNTTSIAIAAKPYVAKDNLTQKDLAAKSSLWEAMVSGMFRNQNGIGDAFELKERMVQKIALGLNPGKKGYLDLLEIAIPELFEALG